MAKRAIGIQTKTAPLREGSNGIYAEQRGGGIVRLTMFLDDTDKTWIDWNYGQIDRLIDVLIEARDTAARRI